MKRRVLGVIPARFASVRLPGKPLANILGKPMIRWVWESATKALDDVIVATDDRRVADAVRGFGGEAMMTPASLPSGTDRMAYVARRRFADFYVNIQGDEPLMHPSTIRDAVRLAVSRKAIATPAMRLEGDFNNPNVVKVVIAADGRAIYFSRSLIPFPRDGKSFLPVMKHLGLYVYPRRELLKFVSLKPTKLEQTERLEQLRALYHGLPIFVSTTKHDSIGVDTPPDVKAVERRLRQGR
jgi:3-deoxy-manno-octulosonate cytidylyltransferase (CMP-KDO synthetase)